MDIVMLAAGSSTRMGETNKLLLEYRGLPMVAYSCLEALRFLEHHAGQNDENCRLIVVTGYRRQSTEKALGTCRSFLEGTGSRLEMLVVNNPDYRNGQFSSTKVGVSQVNDGPFFISLADMPLVTAAHYETLAPLLAGHDAVRPFSTKDGDRVPGHPVLHAPRLKEKILKCSDDCSVSKILRSCDVYEPSFDDDSWSRDIDYAQDYERLSLSQLSVQAQPSL
ncbi:MAG: nucleotidyltransferase family protein [Spirochaetales bacterium]|nr:nucleotidyltransferase family protein [Spirochaetales bacterium]